MQKNNNSFPELIGQQAEVTVSSQPHQRALRGKIVDETKSSLILVREGKEKGDIGKKVRLLKQGLQLRVGGVLVSDTHIRGRPEERRSW